MQAISRRRLRFSLATLAFALLLVGTVTGSSVTLDLLTDSFGGESSFTMVMAGVGTNIPYDSWFSATDTAPKAALDDGIADAGDLASSTQYLFTWDLGPGDYEFTMLDSFGDGICCGFGAGGYDLQVDGISVSPGTDFTGSKESTRFSTAAIPEPSTVGFVVVGLAAIALWRKRRTA